MQKITPFLWFDTQAEEATSFYVSIFKNSRVLRVTRYTEVGPGPVGSVMLTEFELDGQRFTALNGGPQFTFNEAISLVVNVETQEELDEIWDKLLAGGGKPQACGWLKDRFGLSWQIVPAEFWKLMSDPGKVDRVMRALMEMVKLDIGRLKEAAEQG